MSCFSKMKHKYTILIISSFIILSFLSISLLLYTHNLLGASDMQFHVRRIAELRYSVIHGNFFPKFSFNEFNGSSIMTMYPYVNLFPIVLISFLIKSSINVIYVYFLITIFTSFLVSYFSSLSYNHNIQISYLFSLFYSMSTFYIDYGFYNMDLGMLSVITVFPLVLFGFIALLNKSKWVELSIGMTLIVFSHILSVFIISGFLVVLMLLNINKITKKSIINLIKAALLTIITTSVFWIPFIYLMVRNAGNINRPGALNLYGTGFKSLFLGALYGKETYGISLFAIFGAILSVCLFKYLTKLEKQMCVLSILAVIICSNLFPWNITLHGIFRIFRGFQFTWRFYIIPQILLSYLCAVCVVRILKKFSKNIRNIALCGIMIVLVFVQIISQVNIINYNINSHPFTMNYVHNHTILSKSYVHGHIVYIHTLKMPHSKKDVKKPELYRIANQRQYDTILSPYINQGLDYYPMNSLPKINSVVNNEAVSNNSKEHVKYIGYNKIRFNNSKESRNVILPFVKYNGENLKIVENGHVVKSVNNKYNLVMVKHVKKGLNNIEINNSNNNMINYLEYIFLIVGLFIYLYLIIRKFYYNKRFNNY